MTEEEMEFRLELDDKLNDIAYDEFLRLRKHYEDDHLDKIAIGVQCAVDYILDNYDLKPKSQADGESRGTK